MRHFTHSKCLCILISFTHGIGTYISSTVPELGNLRKSLGTFASSKIQIFFSVNNLKKFDVFEADVDKCGTLTKEETPGTNRWMVSQV